MCTFSPGLSVYCLYTCRSNMCAALNDYIPQIYSLSWLLLFFNLQKEENKTQKERKKRALCVIVRDLRGGGVIWLHEQF